MQLHNYLMGSIASYKITLKNKEQIADNTYAFTFIRPDGFKYYAGQHARLTVPGMDNRNRESLSRFFSFASAPHETDLVFAMRMSDSFFKRSLYAMKNGDQLLLQIRRGGRRRSFSWRDHPEVNCPAVFIVGGIGVVPALSMIKDAIAHQSATPIYLFYSNQRPENAAYLTELERMTRDNHGFTLITTMTKPATSSREWQGKTAYINRDMIKAYIPDLVKPTYYLAGRSGMVISMFEMIRGFGVPKARIRDEYFDSQKMHRMVDSGRRRALNLKAIIPVLFVAAMIAAHLTAALSLRHELKFLPSFGYMGLALTSGVIMATIGFKVGLILSRRHKRN